MSEAMNAMEKLLHEADNKFNEKLRLCQGGVPTNMNVYSDRTHNLRQQVSHNPQLTSDDHFMEMLADTEQALAPEFTIRGEMDRRLTSLLRGLLKTLLREAVSQPMFAIRKIQVEMIWQWYEDKKRVVLDFAIGLNKTEQQRQHQVSSGAHHEAVSGDTTIVSFDGTSRSITGGDDAPLSSPWNRTGAPAATSKYGNRLKAFVVNPEDEVVAAFSNSTASFGASSAASGVTRRQESLAIRDDLSAADARNATTAKKFTMYKKRNLGKAEKLRQELQLQQPESPLTGTVTTQPSEVKVVYTKDAKSRQKKVSEARQQLVTMRHGPSGPPSYLHHESAAPFFTRDPTEASALENAVGGSHQHLVRYFASKMSQDSDRRDMRDTMTLYDFNRARLEEETNRRLESDLYASQLGRTCHTILRKSASATETRPGPMRFNIGQKVKPGATTTEAQPAETAPALLGHVVYDGPASTLSPYDHRQVSKLDEVKLESFLQRYSNTATSTAHQGFLTGKPAGTPVQNLTPMTQQAVANAKGYRPSSDAMLDVVLAPDAKVTTVGPRLDIPMAEQLFCNNDLDTSGPSMRQLDEYRLASRVREAFGSDPKPGARPGSAHHYPRHKIHKALVTPDDHASGDCMKLLPVYGSFLPRRPATAGTMRR